MIDSVQTTRLSRAMTRVAANAEGFSGHCFRCVKPKYSRSLDAFSGEGSRKASGRFHVKGTFVIVYTSTYLKTAEWEYFHTARSIGIDAAYLLPYTAISANVRFSKVLNLDNSDVRKSLKVSLKELRRVNWDGSSEETLTQVIGRLAFEAGFEAILAPSTGGVGEISTYFRRICSLIRLLKSSTKPNCPAHNLPPRRLRLAICAGLCV